MASRRIAGLTIEIDGNTTKLNDALKSVDKQLSSTQSQLRDVEKLLKMDPRNTELLAQKQKLLTDAISGTKDRLKELEKAQDQLNQKDASPELEKQQQALQREIIATKKQLEGFEKELQNVPNKAEIAFKAVGETLQQTGEKISSVGENMTKFVTGPIVGVGAAATAAFNEVDDAMDTVIKKTGATGEAAQELQGVVEELATTIPTDFNTAADAVGEVSTKFGATGTQLEALSSKFIKFASINETDVAGSIDNVQKATNAYGLKLTDIDHLLDILSKTSQDTGADVNSLANGIVQNSAAFQEMGLSIDEAVELMGQMERSGANSETVMNGLRKALKQSAKDGVPLSKTLADLQDKIKNNTNETEALNAAYEIFGKSGDQIYSAIRNGTLDFSNFGDTLSKVGNVVDKTFDETVDGVDRWKMAMNEAKLLGADIGGILSEFAGPILQKVRDALAEAVGWWRNLNENQQETILKVAGVVAAVGPAVTVIGKMTSAVGLLSQGLGILAAHPVAAAILGITAAVTAGTIAISEHVKAVRAEYDEYIGLTEAVKENREAVEQSTEAYNTSHEAKQSVIESTEAEMEHLHELSEEYDGLLDSNGKVKKGYEDRAEFILTTLSQALGLEREEIEKIIQKNGELTTSIDDVINKRKAEIILNQYESQYAEAITEAKKAKDNLATAEANAATQQEKVNKLQAEFNKYSKQEIENGEAMNEAYWEAHDALEKLGPALEDAKAELDAQNQTVEDARTVYEDWETTVKNYEGVSAAVISGDVDKINTALDQFQNDFKTTESATEATLKKQYEALNTEYANMEKAVKGGSKSITKADLEEKKYWRDQALKQYNMARTEAATKANETVDAYATKIRGGRKKVENASDYVAGGVIDPLTGLKGKAKDYGDAVSAGLAEGIRRSQSLATYAAANVASAVEEKLRGALQINSPSKLTQYFGRMLDEGLAIGMESGAAEAAAQKLARDVTLPFQAEVRSTVASSTPSGGPSMVEAFQSALSRMKVEMDDREMGRFVENTVVKAVYA